MASCAERRGGCTAVALALGMLLSGCVSGHVLDAARRREVPAGVTAAALAGDDLVVVVDTTTVTDLDRPVGRGTTRARVALAALASGRPIDRFPVRFARVRAPLPQPPLPVVPAAAPSPPGRFARLSTEPPAALLVYGLSDEAAVLWLDTLTRRRYRPWAWAVMPLAVAVDVAIVPPLLLLAPIVMVIGD
jgi:hypothetical protein